ncbi:MAG: YfhO family protein [bacterium]|nr:YfhO family protein [bacterium]
MITYINIKKLREVWPYLILIGIILFNVWTLWPELTVKADPNDNAFQFGLVQRMNEVWQQTPLLTSPSALLSLVDHWVPTWVEGYPLPFYYQHLPQLLIVSFYNLFLRTIPLYTVFNLVKFIFLALFPLSLFISARRFDLSKSTAAFTALFGSQILTNGLFGADVSSFIWRGYGLSSQQWALFLAPLALSQAYQTIKNKNGYFLSLFLIATTISFHLAIGFIVVLSALLIPLSFLEFKKPINLKELFKPFWPLIIVLSLTAFTLAYWLIPLYLGGAYHNVSFWDPVVKWNSYGFNEVVYMFLNGQLFDFNRLPILTFFVVIGFLVSLYRFSEKYRFFSLLFILWLALYFGRPTWGPLLNLVPLLSEMHLERLISGVHLAGIFLIGIGIGFIFEAGKKNLLVLGAILALAIPVYQANFSFLGGNTSMILQANSAYQIQKTDLNNLLKTIKGLPEGRVYAGRPANWGREFKIGTVQMYLVLSQKELPISGFLPETWSINSEPEPFFDESRLSHFNLYNIRYLVTPPNQPPPNFAKKIDTFGQFNLSEIPTTGYFDIGTSNLLVTAKKENIANILHFWITSDLPDNKEYPTMVLDNNKPDLSYLTSIRMTDTSNYLKDNQSFSLFSLKYPLKPAPAVLGKLDGETINQGKYQSKVEMSENCENCFVIFKMTYHPNWQAKVDGKEVKTMMVFPSFLAVQVPSGTHQVSFEYKPSPIKAPLIVLGIISLLGFYWLRRKGVIK